MRMYNVRNCCYGGGYITPSIEDVREELIFEGECGVVGFSPAAIDNFLVRLSEMNTGESGGIGCYTIQIVEVTMNEFEALPEFQGW